MTVRELNDKLQALDVDQLVRDAIQSNASKITTLNKRQLDKGETIDGDLIRPQTTVSYANMKQSIGSISPFRTPDLKFTGAFEKGFFLTVEDNDYYIESSDEKAGMLAEKYKKIFGLTKESQDTAKEFNTRLLGKMFKEKSGL